MKSLLKKPSAWLPIVISLAVLAIILVILRVAGIPTRETDEGTGAHLFQIWLVLEVFLIAFFAIKWLPRRPTQALLILALQIVAVLAACTPVFLLKL